MKAKVDLDMTVTDIHIHLDQTLTHQRRVTHLVQVSGYLSTTQTWNSPPREKFTFELRAGEDLCRAIEKLIQEQLNATTEEFPKEMGV